MFPGDELLLLPLDPDLTSFYTSFSVRGKEFAFSFYNVPSPVDQEASLRNARIQCDSETRHLLSGFDSLLQKRLNESIDLPTFILELKDILGNVNFTTSETSLPPAEFYKSVYKEISSLGLDRLAFVGSGLNELHFRIFDEAGREHVVAVLLPVDYPKTHPLVTSDLPRMLELDWQGEGSIKKLLQQYEEAILSYQDFWAVMEDLDKKFWIMEPEHPSRANTFRRVALGNHCSLSLTVDPSAPRSVPECRFFGSDTIVGPLRNKLNKNIRKWNSAKYLTENLVEVLEMAFPSRQGGTNEDISVACGICYAFRLSDEAPTSSNLGGEGIVPDRACDNGNCGRPFHNSCLVEWLRSITTTRQSFDVLFGNCPYCSHPIAVKLPST